jgi:hypothetical protein
LYRGLFSEPKFEFPGSVVSPSAAELEKFGGLLLPGDLLATVAVAKGTKYTVGHILVTSVDSADVITVGSILQAVIRKTDLLFIISVYDAIRTKMSFFQACPKDMIDIVDFNDLSDFKPLVKRDHGTCFHFVLHHHLTAPLS